MAAWFLGNVDQKNPAETVPALHKAFLAMGGLTVLSSVTFWSLNNSDGANISHHHEVD
jgi:hypothetical protein